MLKIFEEAERCMLCADPPCTAACAVGGDPAKAIRSIRFKNPEGASAAFADGACIGCGACERSCIHYDRPLRIAEMMKASGAASVSSRDHADLSIEFCGVKCENPFFLSSSVVASGYDMCARALEMGWAGIVYKTIGILDPEEVSPRFSAVGESGSPFYGFRNLEQISEHPLADDLEVIKRLKKNYPSKVIVASIMGSNDEEWTELARLCTEIGCDIIECNFSCPQMTGHGLGSDVGTDPELVAEYTAAVRKGTHLPVLAKMTPNVTNMEIPAIAAVEAGADGLAAINTIKSITGLDLPALVSAPAIRGCSAVSGYSGNAVKPIALRFIHDMAVCEKLRGVPISGMGGIETWRDAVDFLALGCINLQVTTSVMQYGYRIIDDLIDGLSAFMAENGYERLIDLVGKGLDHIASADELDRKTVCFPTFDTEKCLGCGRCYISCSDGGHQAIVFDIERRVPSLVKENCVGCHLCRLVCPVQAIGSGERSNKKRKE